MLAVELADQVLYVEFLTRTRVQFGKSKLHIRAQPCQLINPFQQIAAELLLCRLRQSGSFG